MPIYKAVHGDLDAGRVRIGISAGEPVSQSG